MAPAWRNFSSSIRTSELCVSYPDSSWLCEMRLVIHVSHTQTPPDGLGMRLVSHMSYIPRLPWKSRNETIVLSRISLLSLGGSVNESHVCRIWRGMVLRLMCVCTCVHAQCIIIFMIMFIQYSLTFVTLPPPSPPLLPPPPSLPPSSLPPPPSPPPPSSLLPPPSLPPQFIPAY